jgi:hypothetical protein
MLTEARHGRHRRTVQGAASASPDEETLTQAKDRLPPNRIGADKGLAAAEYLPGVVPFF